MDENKLPFSNLFLCAKCLRTIFSKRIMFWEIKSISCLGEKSCSWGRKGLKLTPEEQPCSQKNKGLSCLEKKCLSCSLKKKKLIAPHGNLSSFSFRTWLFLGEKGNSMGKGPSSSKKTYVPKNLQLEPSHVCYYISLQPIIGKDLEESYNFVVGSISIKFYMKIFKSNKFSNTFVPQGT